MKIKGLEVIHKTNTERQNSRQKTADRPGTLGSKEQHRDEFPKMSFQLLDLRFRAKAVGDLETPASEDKKNKNLRLTRSPINRPDKQQVRRQKTKALIEHHVAGSPHTSKDRQPRLNNCASL